MAGVTALLLLNGRLPRMGRFAVVAKVKLSMAKEVESAGNSPIHTHYT